MTAFITAASVGLDFLASSVGAQRMGATITPQHLLYNRNALFQGGLRPHMYCLPVLKRETHQLALRIRALLELRLRHTVTADEVTYLTMHIARMELGMRTRN